MLHLLKAGKYISGDPGNLSPGALSILRKRCAIRRNDSFTLSLLAALLDSFGIRQTEKPLPHPPSDCALLTLSSLGPRKMIESFQNDLMDYPPENAMPTSFSNSVNNAAAGSLAALFHLTGPAFSLTGFSSLARAAWTTTGSILNTGLAGHILLLYAEDPSLLANAMNREGLLHGSGQACALLLSAKKENGPDLPLTPDILPLTDTDQTGFFKLVDIFKKEFPES